VQWLIHRLDLHIAIQGTLCSCGGASGSAISWYRVFLKGGASMSKPKDDCSVPHDRVRWTCPQCGKRYSIPAGFKLPECCPACRDAIKSDDDIEASVTGWRNLQLLLIGRWSIIAAVCVFAVIGVWSLIPGDGDTRPQPEAVDDGGNKTREIPIAPRWEQVWKWRGTDDYVSRPFTTDKGNLRVTWSAYTTHDNPECVFTAALRRADTHKYFQMLANKVLHAPPGYQFENVVQLFDLPPGRYELAVATENFVFGEDSWTLEIEDRTR